MLKSLSRSKCVSPDLVESEHLENRLTFVSLCPRHLPAIIAAVMLWTNSAFAQTTATYIGPNNGNWSNPANWDIGVVPINSGANTYNVIVPAGKTINFDIAGANDIAGLNLQDTGQINLGIGQSLNVTGFTLVAGNIVANGAGSAFTASSPLTVIQPSPELHAANGAVVQVAVSSYVNNRGYDRTFMSAIGTGSILQMSSVTFFDSNGGFLETVEAGQGGTINLSGVQTIDGAQNEGRLRFLTHTGGSINLQNLTTVTQTNDISAYWLQNGAFYGRTVFEFDSGSLSLPNLVDADGVRFVIPSGGSVSLPTLTSLRNSSLDLPEGAVFNAPLLSDIRGSYLRVARGAAINTLPLSQINDAELHAHSGGQISVAASSYVNNRGYGRTFMSAIGTGSTLQMSSVTSFDSNGQFLETVEAGQGGTINLSGVQTIDGAQNEGRLRFWTHTGGSINLQNLTTVTQTNDISAYWLQNGAFYGRTLFDVDSGSFSLPNLSNANGVSFDVAPFASVNLPNLTSMRNSKLDIQALATVNTPALTDITGSYLRVSGGTVFTAPAFTAINDAELHAHSGGQISVAASSYVNNRGYDRAFMSAIGTGSILQMSSVKSFDSNGAFLETVEARQGGTVNLSGLQTIDGAQQGTLRFHSSNAGRINIGSSGQTTNLVGGRTLFEVTGNNSVIRFGSNMNMASNTELKATLNGRFEAEGNLNIRSTNPNSFDLKGGTLRMVGNSASMSGPQTLEVVSADIGLPSGALGNIGQIGQLQIGTNSISSRVILQDSFDNNLGIQGREALYLQGFPATNGLRILNGSTLILNGQNAYTSNGQGTFTSLRSLIAPGQRTVAYDGGFISLTGEVGEVINSGFDSGDPSSPGVLPSFILSAPSSGGGGRIVSTPTPGNPNNKVAEIYAGSMVEMAQFVSTLDSPFRIEFDAMARHSTGELSLLLNNTLLDSWTWAELGANDFSSFFVTVNDPLLRGLIDTKLAFRWNANTGHAVWLDNIRMTAVPEPGAGLVMLMAAAGLSLKRRRRTEACQKITT